MKPHACVSAVHTACSSSKNTAFIYRLAALSLYFYSIQIHLFWAQEKSLSDLEWSIMFMPRVLFSEWLRLLRNIYIYVISTRIWYSCVHVQVDHNLNLRYVLPACPHVLNRIWISVNNWIDQSVSVFQRCQNQISACLRNTGSENKTSQFSIHLGGSWFFFYSQSNSTLPKVKRESHFLHNVWWLTVGALEGSDVH